MSVVNTGVLVLNRVYQPIHVTSLKRAFCMVCTGVAKIVDEQYRTFDFVSWSAVAVEASHETIGVVGRVIRVPRVILLMNYDKMPKRRIRFSRYNIFLRDGNTCQYCGKKYQRDELNLDHVVPRSRGGMSTWENVVSSCIRCNRKKGGRTPLEAGMKLLRKPVRPNWTASLNYTLKSIKYAEWKQFLNLVDISYWNVELEK